MRAIYVAIIVAGCAGTEMIDDTARPPTNRAAATQPGAGSLFDRLGDTEGPVPGLPGFSFVHVADTTRCGGTAVVVIRDTNVAVAGQDAALVEMLGLTFPEVLDFGDGTERTAKAAKAATAQFAAWLDAAKTVTTAATKAYKDELAVSRDPARKVAAAARLVQVMRRFAAVIARASIPATVAQSDVRDGNDLAPDKIDAYCDALVTAAEPLLAQADQAADTCAALAARAGTGWWSTVCVH